jgi:hypothetical protein
VSNGSTSPAPQVGSLASSFASSATRVAGTRNIANVTSASVDAISAESFVEVRSEMMMQQDWMQGAEVPVQVEPPKVEQKFRGLYVGGDRFVASIFNLNEIDSAVKAVGGKPSSREAMIYATNVYDKAIRAVSREPRDAGQNFNRLQ